GGGGRALERMRSEIGADASKLPMDRVRLFHGSTTYLKDGYGSYHSRPTVMGGWAILLAVGELRDKLKAAAAARFGCAADDVKLADGKATGPDDKSAAWSELASNGTPPSAEATFSNHKHTYAYGAGAAHVTVDPKT